MFLHQALPEAEIIHTSLADRPAFVDRAVNMIYMGQMSENSQLRVLELMRPFCAAIQEHIEADRVLLLTGNAYEIMGEAITSTDGTRHEGLGLYGHHSVENQAKRWNSMMLGQFNPSGRADQPAEGETIDVTGYRSQFTQVFGIDDSQAFLRIERGTGSHFGSSFEGIRDRNYVGTNLIGPLLPTNPRLAAWLLNQAGVDDPVIPHADAAEAAYHERLSYYRRYKKSTGIDA